MAQPWEPNDEKDENEELAITEHRDAAEPAVTAEDEQAVEVAEPDPRAALDALGEDVASSPARRGHEDPEISAERG
ncbi:hypothetical protein [Leucobacter massiliensis]|uniref:Uncharacterized protein n=1 Tax=Leucobacter massiliensis TaxID=1686285 RepID=A0A2S9QKA6_9MICO|nr:hypothetical protein [Leucobacter massiliensis]PRI10012.1 hypothetical protein B4915_13895 [Leucobacter massiliensis]